MQAVDLRRCNTEYQPGPRVVWSYLYGHNLLLRTHCDRRNDARSPSLGCPCGTLSLLQFAHEPRQQGHRTNKKYDDQKGLRHVRAIHG
jgi:hypothetical protein